MEDPSSRKRMSFYNTTTTFCKEKGLPQYFGRLRPGSNLLQSLRQDTSSSPLKVLVLGGDLKHILCSLPSFADTFGEVEFVLGDSNWEIQARNAFLLQILTRSIEIDSWIVKSFVQILYSTDLEEDVYALYFKTLREAIEGPDDDPRYKILWKEWAKQGWSLKFGEVIRKSRSDKVRAQSGTIEEHLNSPHLCSSERSMIRNWYDSGLFIPSTPPFMKRANPTLTCLNPLQCDFKPIAPHATKEELQWLFPEHIDDRLIFAPHAIDSPFQDWDPCAIKRTLNKDLLALEDYIIYLEGLVSTARNLLLSSRLKIRLLSIPPLDKLDNSSFLRGESFNVIDTGLLADVIGTYATLELVYPLLDAGKRRNCSLALTHHRLWQLGASQRRHSFKSHVESELGIQAIAKSPHDFSHMRSPPCQTLSMPDNYLRSLEWYFPPLGAKSKLTTRLSERIFRCKLCGSSSAHSKETLQVPGALEEEVCWSSQYESSSTTSSSSSSVSDFSTNSENRDTYTAIKVDCHSDSDFSTTVRPAMDNIGGTTAIKNHFDSGFSTRVRLEKPAAMVNIKGATDIKKHSYSDFPTNVKPDKPAMTNIEWATDIKKHSDFNFSEKPTMAPNIGGVTVIENHSDSDCSTRVRLEKPAMVNIKRATDIKKHSYSDFSTNVKPDKPAMTNIERATDIKKHSDFNFSEKPTIGGATVIENHLDSDCSTRVRLEKPAMINIGGTTVIKNHAYSDFSTNVRPDKPAMVNIERATHIKNHLDSDFSTNVRPAMVNVGGTTVAKSYFDTTIDSRLESDLSTTVTSEKPAMAKIEGTFNAAGDSPTPSGKSGCGGDYNNYYYRNNVGASNSLPPLSKRRSTSTLILPTFENTRRNIQAAKSSTSKEIKTANDKVSKEEDKRKEVKTSPPIKGKLVRCFVRIWDDKIERDSVRKPVTSNFTPQNPFGSLRRLRSSFEAADTDPRRALGRSRSLDSLGLVREYVKAIDMSETFPHIIVEEKGSSSAESMPRKSSLHLNQDPSKRKQSVSFGKEDTLIIKDPEEGEEINNNDADSMLELDEHEDESELPEDYRPPTPPGKSHTVHFPRTPPSTPAD